MLFLLYVEWVITKPFECIGCKLSFQFLCLIWILYFATLRKHIWVEYASFMSATKRVVKFKVGRWNAKCALLILCVLSEHNLNQAKSKGEGLWSVKALSGCHPGSYIGGVYSTQWTNNVRSGLLGLVRAGNTNTVCVCVCIVCSLSL